MRTGMMLENRLQAVTRQVGRQVFVLRDGTKLLFHLGCVAGYEIIASCREQAFGVLPRSADEGNSASQCFEHANGGNSRERASIGASRNVDGRPESRQGIGHKVIGEPSAVFDAGARQRLAGMRGVTNSVNAGGQTQLPDRAHQELFQLSAALAITPISDPDQVTVIGAAGPWPEDPGIGSLMPCPCALGPSQLQVEFPEYFSERQDAIVMPEIIGGHRARIGDRAMMRVMEEQDVIAGPRPMPPDSRYQMGRIPLVNQCQVDIFQSLVQVKRFEIVTRAGELWKGLLEFAKSLLA